MSRILIVYGTTEGQTRKIATYVADACRKAGDSVDLHDATLLPEKLDIESFDHVVIAASLHRERHQASVEHFIRANLLALQNVPTAFLSVSLSAAGDDEDQRAARTCMNRFLLDLHWQPRQTLLVAGALRFTEYDYFKRWMLKRIAREKGAPTDTSQDHEFTDWAALDRFVSQLAR